MMVTVTMPATFSVQDSQRINIVTVEVIVRAIQNCAAA